MALGEQSHMSIHGAGGHPDKVVRAAFDPGDDGACMSLSCRCFKQLHSDKDEWSYECYHRYKQKILQCM